MVGKVEYGLRANGFRQPTTPRPGQPRWSGVGVESRSPFARIAKTRTKKTKIGGDPVSYFPSDHTTPTQDPIIRPSAYDIFLDASRIFKMY